jgi:SAM-dependent methyltransferase
MINATIRVFKRYAWFKRVNARITYEALARYIPSSDWQFMNYGYNPNANEPPSPCKGLKTTQPYPLQMYHYLALKAPLENKVVLEVGSGRGGGARHIAETFKPAQYIGLDIAKSAVDLANKLHVLPNLKFMQGSAEALPFEDNSIDVVINVESCHAYGCVDTFLSEVKRVLKPGGFLLLVDFRNIQAVELFKSQLENSKLSILEHEDISDAVITAIETENDAKLKRIAEVVPSRWQKLFGQFAGVVGSPFHETLKNRTRFYYRVVLQK